MSEIRYITIPQPIRITLPHPETGVDVPALRTFEQFVHERTTDAVVFGANLDGIMLGLAIRQAVKGCRTGQVIGLLLVQWEALCKAIRTPHGGYNAPVMFQIMPHATAILDAPTTKPEGPVE